MTRETCCTSMPRAHTSVVIRTLSKARVRVRLNGNKWANGNGGQITCSDRS